MSALSSQLRFVEQTGTGLYRRARRALGLPPVAPGSASAAPVRETEPAADGATRARISQQAAQQAARAAAESAIRTAARARVLDQPAAHRNAFTLTIQIMPLVVFVALAIIFAAWIPEIQRMY